MDKASHEYLTLKCKGDEYTSLVHKLVHKRVHKHTHIHVHVAREREQRWRDLQVLPSGSLPTSRHVIPASCAAEFLIQDTNT